MTYPATVCDITDGRLNVELKDMKYMQSDSNGKPRSELYALRSKITAYQSRSPPSALMRLKVHIKVRQVGLISGCCTRVGGVYIVVERVVCTYCVPDL